MTRLSVLLRQLAGSSPKRKFKPKPRTRRKSLEWKDGWDVLLPANPVLVQEKYERAAKKGLVTGGGSGTGGASIAGQTSAGSATAVAPVATSAASASSSGG